ncbi:MAG: BamA/TamA family outer membrane protein [Flavipsychrobacter sp.]
MTFTKLGTYIIAITAIFFTACSNTKHLPAGDSLYIGDKVKLTDKKEATRKEDKVIKSDLEAAVRPKPNTKTLGMRIKLRLYNFAGTSKKKKGLRHWLHDKVGEPPVLTSTVDLNFNKELLVNILQNRGFFYPSVDAHLDTKHKKTKAVFDVVLGPQYTINKVFFLRDSSRIAKDINDLQDQTLLDTGQSYNLTLIKAERDRIDRGLKEEGYYFFKSDYILLLADTSVGDHKVNLYLRLKREEIPEEAYKVYTINKVYVFPNYKLNSNGSDTSKANAVVYKTYYIIDPKKKFNPQIFPDNLMFATGDLYNRTDQNKSLSRLVNLGTFKFVKNRFEVSPNSDTLLDAYYYLTTYPKKSIRFQIGALTQNDNRAGSQASISWLNRNTFKGAELFQIKLNGGFEAQYSGQARRPNIYNTGAEADLSFPRFMVPFVNIGSNSAFTPKTMIKAIYNYESQSDLLRINSYKVSYGYDWKEDLRKEHQLYPFNFTYVKTDTLGDASRLGLLYGNLVFNGIIIGPTYEFTYNSQVGPQKTSSFYFDFLIDLSGNVLGLAEHANYKDHPQTLFGSTYAQYLKYQLDYRYYFRMSRSNILASRILIGEGLPYGNSYQLPNIKQFFSGGSSSLRGFPTRLVGPGTFNENYLYGTNQYIETLGDMKLELNTELRTNVYKFFSTALFVDAGNIWLYNDNPQFPGGKFTKDFYKQLAVDMGIGFRFDVKILLIRLDIGMPVREPYLPENDRWVFNKINFGDPTWRKNNLVFNIAIGYPF